MSLGRGCDASGVAGGRKVETSQERGRKRAGGGCRLKHMQQTRGNRAGTDSAVAKKQHRGLCCGEKSGGSGWRSDLSASSSGAKGCAIGGLS
jgi:hypothetical protein